MKNENSINKLGIILGIGGIVLGSILTTIFGIYETNLKNFLGVAPQIIWEKQTINSGDFHAFKATIYNESLSYGDITLAIMGKYTENDFEIKGHQSKIELEMTQKAIRQIINTPVARPSKPSVTLKALAKEIITKEEKRT